MLRSSHQSLIVTDVVAPWHSRGEGNSDLALVATARTQRHGAVETASRYTWHEAVRRRVDGKC